MDIEHITQSTKKKILILYMALGASIVLQFIPMKETAIGAAILFFGAWIACYVIRREQRDNEFVNSHTTHIIRTIWIMSILFIATIVFAVVYLIGAVDNAPLDICMNTMMGLDPNESYDQVMVVLQPCLDNYIEVNKTPLGISAAIAILPIAIYFIIKYIRGLRAAIDGRAIANVKGLF